MTANPGVRLREIMHRLHAADVQLNNALEQLEDVFEIKLPVGSYGCLLLWQPHSNGTNTQWMHLVYDEAIIWIETWSEHQGFWREDVINHDVRENKIEACRRARDLWILCGGKP